MLSLRTFKTKHKLEKNPALEGRGAVCCITVISSLISIISVFFIVAYLSVYPDSSGDKQKGFILTKKLSERLRATKKEEGSKQIMCFINNL